ncbi:MAG: hypothetical protein CL678_17520 [Bdellovibrionaceae bacterium]|nr:hypothetical protein [Pseudobdellovibrionaceae bacterium]
MNHVLQKWFGDDVELTIVSPSCVHMYLNREKWLSGRTLQHILLNHNWEFNLILNPAGQSMCTFSQMGFMPTKPSETTKNADLANSMCSFLQTLFNHTNHSVTANRQQVGSTLVVTVEPGGKTLRLDTALLTTILDHPRTFDIHIKHNKLVVMETLELTSPYSLAALRRQGKITAAHHDARTTRQRRISKGLKKIARRRVSLLRRN